jgi:hypothetical protein
MREVSRSRLTFENLTGGYGSTTIVRDLAGAAIAGEVLRVLGRNGVGKTTLMKLLADQPVILLDEPSERAQWENILHMESLIAEKKAADVAFSGRAKSSLRRALPTWIRAAPCWKDRAPRLSAATCLRICTSEPWLWIPGLAATATPQNDEVQRATIRLCAVASLPESYPGAAFRLKAIRMLRSTTSATSARG